MADIAKVKGTNGYKMVSTFSGCGGSCLGFEMAGFEVIYASEFVEAAREVYNLNHPGVFIDDRDIRKVSATDILTHTGLEVGELDVFEGSPPCASFSTAGKRDKDWGKTKKYSDTRQRTDDLFFEYARLVQGLQPKIFVAENVAGLVRGSAKGYFKDIFRRLTDCGYRVEAKLLDAQWLGVPQTRNRIIIQGIRNDLVGELQWPEPLPHRYTIRDACPWITNDGIAKKTFGTAHLNGVAELDVDKPVATVMAHGIGGKCSDEALFLNEPPIGGEEWFNHLRELGHPDCDEIEYRIVDISHYAIGREWLRVKVGDSSEKYFSLIRSSAEKPIGAITATAGTVGAAGVCHPSEARKFTIPEVRRLCSYPDDFQLTGSFPQRWERLGRSVPPLMMKTVADKIQETLDEATK
jgi:DNA (cytosine-5)-methyltransferase 1